MTSASSSPRAAWRRSRLVGSGSRARSRSRLNSAAPYNTQAWPPINRWATRCLRIVERALRIGLGIKRASHRDVVVPEPGALLPALPGGHPVPVGPLRLADVLDRDHRRNASTPLPPPSLRVQRLASRPSGLDLVELSGFAQAAEEGRGRARVHRLLQGGAVAAVGLLGHQGGSEGLVGEAVDHAGDQLAGHDPLADEFAEILRLLFPRSGGHQGSGQIRRRKRSGLEGLEVLPHFLELGGVNGALLAVMDLLLLVVLHLLLVVRDPRLQLGQDL